MGMQEGCAGQSWGWGDLKTLTSQALKTFRQNNYFFLIKSIPTVPVPRAAGSCLAGVT